MPSDKKSGRKSTKMKDLKTRKLASSKAAKVKGGAEPVGIKRPRPIEPINT